MAEYKTPPGADYAGPSGIARESVWLTQEDISHEKDTTLLIEAVRRRDNVKFESGPAKKIMLSLKFAKFERELGLNATNRKTLNALFGTKCSEWAGKRITLFVQQDVSSPKGLVPAVRIRAKRVADNAPLTEPKPAPKAPDPIDRDFEEEAIRADGQP